MQIAVANFRYKLSSFQTSLNFVSLVYGDDVKVSIVDHMMQ